MDTSFMSSSDSMYDTGLLNADSTHVGPLNMRPLSHVKLTCCHTELYWAITKIKVCFLLLFSYPFACSLSLSQAHTYMLPISLSSNIIIKLPPNIIHLCFSVYGGNLVTLKSKSERVYEIFSSKTAHTMWSLLNVMFKQQNPAHLMTTGIIGKPFSCLGLSPTVGS